MTSQLPPTVLVMISDEKLAGRIAVELDTFVRFNIAIDRQLDELESRLLQWQSRQRLRRRSPRHRQPK